MKKTLFILAVTVLQLNAPAWATLLSNSLNLL